MNTHPSDLADLAKIITKGVAPQIVTVKGQGGPDTEVLIHPGELEVTGVKKFLDAYLTQPERRKGTATLSDLDSFVRLTTRFQAENSAIFCDPSAEKPSLTTVFNYNPDGGDEKNARFGDHRAFYGLPLSDEWKAWTGVHGKQLGQGEFAEYLEDRIGDVMTPPDLTNGTGGSRAENLIRTASLLNGSFAIPAQMMELARGLHITESAKVKNAVNLSSGELQVQYETSHNDVHGAPIRVPSLFIIAIPVFRGATVLDQIVVRLRYRLREGAIRWSFALYQPERVIDLAIREAADKAADSTGLPLFYGAPERT